jgi:hypothetical protein
LSCFSCRAARWVARGSSAAAGAAGAGAAAAAARFPAAGRPRVAGLLAGAGLGALGGATSAAAPFLTYLFPILKLSCQLSKAQAQKGWLAQRKLC